MKILHRRYTIWLALALLILLLFLLARSPASAPVSGESGDLTPYLSYLEDYGILPEDVLSYTISEIGGKTTLQLTLQSDSKKPRLLSISVKSLP